MTVPSTVLLQGDPAQINQTGAAKRAAGYYSTAINGGWHTVTADILDFTGRIYIEASLVANPTANDWFAVKLADMSVADADVDGGNAQGNILNYAQYPVDPDNPTDVHGDTGTFGWTFRGNYVWIRARIDRSYLPSTTDVGVARKILMVV